MGDLGIWTSPSRLPRAKPSPALAASARDGWCEVFGVVIMGVSSGLMGGPGMTSTASGCF